MMTKVFGSYVSPEMCFLWVLEFILSFVLIYILSSSTFREAGAWIGVDYQVVNRALVLSLTVGLTAIALGLYRPEICLQKRRLLITSAVAGVIAFPAVLLVSAMFGIGFNVIVGPDRFWPLKSLLAWIVMLSGTRLAFSFATQMRLFVKRIVVVGDETSSLTRVREAISSRGAIFYEIAGSVVASSEEIDWMTPSELRRQRIWGLVLTSAARMAVPAQRLVGYARAGIHVFDEGEFRELQMRRMDVDAIEPGWLAQANSLRASRLESMLRRGGDILIGVVFLALTFPLMVLTAVLIRCDSRGPVFYRQERVGLHGRSFTLLKFRSMAVDAERASGPSWAAQRDPRVTRIGAFIRRTRIDELPQLLNVLKGEMSFIGPRPERPHFVSSLTQQIANYGDRAFVKPGLTGWAQVNFPYGASVEDARMKLSYDLYYVRHRSLLIDILILFATVRVILFQEGAR